MFQSKLIRLTYASVTLFAAPLIAGAAPDFFAFFNSKDPLPAQLPQVSADVAPLLEMEKVLARIRAGEKPETWRPQLARFKAFQGDKGVGAGLRELALAWEARARIQEWDSHLRTAYRKKARFPETLDALVSQVPEELRTDPWGDAWSYALSAPPHSPKLMGQRYVLVPKRVPKLSSLSDAIKTPPQMPQVTVRFSALAGVASLEVFSKQLQPNRSYKVVGDRFGNHWVMWLAASGVILCNEDGFIAASFQQNAP